MKLREKGLLTLEAALVLPAFAFAVYTLAFFFQVILVQDSLHYYATKVANQLSSYGTITNYLMDDLDEEEWKESEKEQESVENQEINERQGSKEKQESVGGNDGKASIDNKDSEGNEDNHANETRIEEALNPKNHTLFSELIDIETVKTLLNNTVSEETIKNLMRSHGKNNLAVNHCIVGGFEGISFYGTTLFDEEECIQIVMQYQIKLPIWKEVLPTFSVVQRVRVRVFNGHAVARRIADENKPVEKVQYVYVTEHGTVYHTNSNCSHIKIDICEIKGVEVRTLLNSQRQEYNPCKICMKNSTYLPEKVYVTMHGESFHCTKNCSGIKRSVRKIPRSEVGNRKECSRCKARDNE